MTSQFEAILSWKKAENDRKSGRLKEALSYFNEHFKSHANPDAGWRRVYCLRRLGRLEEAKVALAALQEIFPNDSMVHQESVWMIYETTVKPAREANEPQKLLDGARKMLESGAEGIARQLAVFAGIHAAKSLQAWDEVLTLCERVTPQQLQTSPRVTHGKRLPSEREQYYFAAIKAHLSLKQFAEARELSLQASREFPYRLDFQRWAALALEGSGDCAGAIRELSEIVGRGRAPWYISADLAKLLVAQDKPDQGWLAACRAADNPGGEAKAKVNLFCLIARIAESRGDIDNAVRHALLAARLREDEGWQLPTELSDLLLRLPISEPTPSLGELEAACRKGRCGNKAGESEVEPRNHDDSNEVIGESVTGIVSMRQPDAPFAFIKTSKFQEPVFVVVKDLPEGSRHDGAEVRFTAVKSFDRKKNREGIRAMQVIATAT